MNEPILRVRGIRMRYGALDVLKSVNLDIDEGTAFAIIGPNGAGKTSLFKVITGEVRAVGGTIHFAGQDLTTAPAYRRAQMGMGRTFQVARVFPDFTVLNNVITTIETRERAASRAVGPWYAWRPSATVREEAESMLRELALQDRRFDEAKFLSHGDKKRLELAITLAQKPRMLMLDEPTAGMSPSDRTGVIRLIRKLREERGITVLLTEHDMEVIFGLADRLAVLNYGEIVATGNVEEIRQNPLVREVYLGKDLY